MEYYSHIGFFPYTSLLDRVESKAIRLIGDPSLTSTLDPLSLRHKVASLSFPYRYYFGHCSDELAACIPPPMTRPRSIWQATFAYKYCVVLSNVKINQFSDRFFPSTSCLWISLPTSVFPASFLQKTGLSPPYGPDGVILFLITLFRYFRHFILFLFFKGCRLEKGHIVPILCSHSL